MPGSDPQTGDVYYYPYVWLRQGEYGEPEKDRPCCVAIRFTKGGFRGSDTFMLALSQSGVPEGGYGEEVPKEIIEELRKLDSSKPTWIITSEHNADVSDQPSFEDCEYLGTIPKSYLLPILKTLIERLRAGGGEINRTGT